MIDENMWNLIGKFNREQCDPETALERANLNKKNYNFQEAILDYTHYIKYKPEDPLPYLYLADCQYLLKQLELSIENYEKGFSMASGNISEIYLGNYAGALMDNSQNEKALLIVDKLLIQNKRSILGNILKGQILLQLSKSDIAFYYVTRAIELDKNNWNAWATRVKVDYCLGDYFRVVHDFKNALLLNANLPAHYHSAHAFALYNMEKKEEALKEFEHAKNLGDPDAKAFYEKLTTK